MLSEPRRRQKWCANPNGTIWSSDTSKFGSKMLEKMGWTEGKGLGANEDGRTEHIKVKKKNDLRGVGFSNKNAHNWVDHQDGFSSLLADLNGHHNENGASSTGEVASLEQRSKTQKRVHYHKFARGKDLTNYRQNDLDAIFGRKVSKSAPATPVDSSDGSTSGEDSTASCPVIDEGAKKHKTKKCRKLPQNQVTSTMSVQEYFSKRMAMIKNKQFQKSQDTPEVVAEHEEIISATEESVSQSQGTLEGGAEHEEIASTLNNSNSVAEDMEQSKNAEEARTAKKKKKKSKSRKDQVASSEVVENTTEKCNPDPNLLDHVSSDSISKKTKKKKSKKRENAASADDVEPARKAKRTK